MLRICTHLDLSDIYILYKGQIKPKAGLANEFDLFAVEGKKANKTNSLVCFLGESFGFK